MFPKNEARKDPFQQQGKPSRGNKMDKLTAKFADFCRRFSLNFADFHFFFLGGNDSKSEAQIFTENRRFSQIFAETRLSQLVCPFEFRPKPALGSAQFSIHLVLSREWLEFLVVWIWDVPGFGCTHGLQKHASEHVQGPPL